MPISKLVIFVFFLMACTIPARIVNKQDRVSIPSSTNIDSFDATWNTFLGPAEADDGHSVAMDRNGNIYIIGSSTSSWGAPVNIYAGGSDVFVAKLNSKGVLIWNTFLGSAGSDSGYGIAVDGSGNVYATGSSDSSWGSIPINSYVGESDAFVVKLDGNGNLLWHSFLGSHESDNGKSIEIDDGGNLYIAGNSHGTWGMPANAYAGGDDAYIAKVDNHSGKLLWNTFLGSEYDDDGNGIATDPSGNIYMVGESYANWGTPRTAHSQNLKDIFIAKLDGNGIRQWNTFLGSHLGLDFGRDIAVDIQGNSYIVGEFQGTRGSDPNRARSDTQYAFAARINTDGTLEWQTLLGGEGDDYGFGVVVSASGDVFMTGASNSTWGSPINAYVRLNDAYVAALDGNSGVIKWNTFLGSSDFDYGKDIVIDLSGGIYVAGESSSTWANPLRPFAVGYKNVFVSKIDTGN